MHQASKQDAAALFRALLESGGSAPGAWANGTRVVKVKAEPGDGHAIGAAATVLGSIGPIPIAGRADGIGYLVVWDDMPGIPVFVSDFKIEPLS